MSRSQNRKTRPISDTEDENTPRPPSWSDLEGSDAGHLGIEGSFFAEGLSEDAITAASERQREREALQRAASGRANRWVYAVAGAGACAILAFGLAPKDHQPAVSSHRGVHAAAATALPVSPPAATANPAGRTVSVQGLRAVPSEAQTACDQLLQRGKFTDIKTTCARAFDDRPDARLALRLARSALERERYSDAQTWAQRAIEIDRKSSEAFLTLGGAEQGLGHAPQARIAYARYLELAPRGPYADDVRALIDQL